MRVPRAEAVVDDLVQRGLIDAGPALEELDGDAAPFGAFGGEVLGEVDEAEGALELFCFGLWRGGAGKGEGDGGRGFCPLHDVCRC